MLESNTLGKVAVGLSLVATLACKPRDQNPPKKPETPKQPDVCAVPHTPTLGTLEGKVIGYETLPSEDFIFTIERLDGTRTAIRLFSERKETEEQAMAVIKSPGAHVSVPVFKGEENVNCTNAALVIVSGERK